MDTTIGIRGDGDADLKIRLINSDFKLDDNICVDRVQLFERLRKGHDGVFAMYVCAFKKSQIHVFTNITLCRFEPNIYPGVKIKYFYNAAREGGQCKCTNMCSGKGPDVGQGPCKIVTIMVFRR